MQLPTLSAKQITYRFSTLFIIGHVLDSENG